jgi:hypothetical protein
VASTGPGADPSALRTDNLLVAVAGALVVAVVGVPLAAGTPDFAKAFGWPVTLLVWLLLSAGVVALAVVFFAYLRTMEGALAPARSIERNAYVERRKGVSLGGKGHALYARWLGGLLSRVDRFFGDAGQHSAAHSRWFGLQQLAPIWTGSAYDRCLLLALLYPIGVMSLGWLLSGDVGQAEEALGFNGQKYWVTRSVVLVSVLVFVPAAAYLWQGVAARWSEMPFLHVPQRLLEMVAVAGAGYAAIALAGAGAVAVVATVACARAFTNTVPDAVALVVAFLGIVAITVATSLAFDSSRAFEIGLVLYVCGVLIAFVPSAVKWTGESALTRSRLGHFLFGLTCLVLAGSYIVSHMWPSDAREGGRALVLFLVVLTLVNAPFDWLSLGLTRGLLRRGLELRGPWPSALAVLDAALAGLLVAALAATTVIAVQTFDLVAVQAGANPTLPVVPLLDALSVQPEATQHWWLHAMLLSTLVPSLVNLVVGCTSWLRSGQWLTNWVLQRMPKSRKQADRAVRQRVAVALVLTAQWCLGGLMGLALMAFLVWVVLGALLPAAGLGLLDLMRALADWNLPAQ